MKSINETSKWYIETVVLSLILVGCSWIGLNSNFIILGLLIILGVKSLIDAVQYNERNKPWAPIWIVPIECAILIAFMILALIFESSILEFVWAGLEILFLIVNLFLSN